MRHDSMPAHEGAGSGRRCPPGFAHPLHALLLAALLCAGALVAEAPRAHGAPAGEAFTVQMPAGSRLRPHPRRAAPKHVAPRRRAPAVDVSQLRRVATHAAAANNVPTDFFLRLIRQESGFQTDVVSRAGARGIAQFMPATAAAYGLKDPFDPMEALRNPPCCCGC
jgi:soluble lytic murein transglycosylase-like protein